MHDAYVRQEKESNFLRRGRGGPSHIDFELTGRCNNNCVHCCVREDSDLPSLVENGCRTQRAENRAAELTLKQIRRLLHEAADLGCLTVRLTGGEPMLREDFQDIYVTAREMGFRVIISTNACLLTPEIAALFARVPPLEPLDVSLYGMGRETYEEVSRTPGSFEAAWRGVRLLLESNIPFWARTVFLPQNRHDLDAFGNWSSVLREPIYPFPATVLLDLRWQRDSVKRNEAIGGLRARPEDVVAVLSRDRRKYLKEMRRFCGSFLTPPGDLLFSCGAGKNSAGVDARGNILMCLRLRHPDTVFPANTVLGVDAEKALAKALREFFPSVRMKRAENPEYIERCAKCFLFSLCEQCPAKSWIEHGELDRPVEYLCEITHFQAVDLGIIEPGEEAWRINDWAERVKEFTCGNTQARPAESRFEGGRKP